MKAFLWPLHCYGEAGWIDTWYFTSYSIAWSTMSELAPMILFIARLTFVLNKESSEDLTPMPGVRHYQDSNPGSHGRESQRSNH